MAETEPTPEENVSIERLETLLQRVAEFAGSTKHLTRGESNSLSTARVTWAARDGAEVLSVQHDYYLTASDAQLPSRYSERYLIGLTADFCNQEYPPITPDHDYSINVFYHSNSYTEMTGWRDITQVVDGIDRLEAVFAEASSAEDAEA